MPGMPTSEVKAVPVLAQHVTVSDDTLTVTLNDGRTISVPIAWYPRLLHASRSERRNWRLIGEGQGIHWPAIDEDLSVAGLLMGHPSGESLDSFRSWLAKRQPRRVTPVRRPHKPRGRARRSVRT